MRDVFTHLQTHLRSRRATHPRAALITSRSTSRATPQHSTLSDVEASLTTSEFCSVWVCITWLTLQFSNTWRHARRYSRGSMMVSVMFDYATHLYVHHLFSNDHPCVSRICSHSATLTTHFLLCKNIRYHDAGDIVNRPGYDLTGQMTLITKGYAATALTLADFNG